MNPYDSMVQDLVSGPGGFQGAIGYDQIVGLENIIGADNAAKLRQLAAVRAAGGVGVQTAVRDRHRVQPSPFTNTSVAAATKTTLTIQPQRLIQVISLLIPSFLGQLFDVNDLRLAQQTQFITSGSVPAILFSEVADGYRSRVKLDSTDIGALIAIDVTNNDAVNAQTFKGCIFADSVY